MMALLEMDSSSLSSANCTGPVPAISPLMQDWSVANGAEIRNRLGTAAMKLSVLCCEDEISDDISVKVERNSDLEDRRLITGVCH